MREQSIQTTQFRNRTIALAVAFVVVFFGSFMLGKYPIMPDELIRILASKVFDIPQTWPDAAENVVFQIRLPRVIAAGLIGAALAVAGVSYQGMFQNPMVSPGVLGASSGAGSVCRDGFRVSVLKISFLFFIIISPLSLFFSPRMDTVSGLTVPGRITGCPDRWTSGNCSYPDRGWPYEKRS